MTIKDIKKYILAGKANFTIVSTKLNERYTYKIYKDRYKPTRYLCEVMYGQDNDNDYRFLGWFYKYELELHNSSATTGTAYKMLSYFLFFVGNECLPDTCEFYPSDRCARCGRKLTTPESIRRGFGPECYEEAQK